MASATPHALLNVGFRLPATGGTDNFPDVWRDPPPGTGRTYAKVEGRLSVQSWLAAVKAGRTFGTNGPLVRFTVNGLEPGSELKLASSATETVRVRVSVTSIAPIDRVDILVNGVAATSVSSAGRTAIEVDQPVPVPLGGWVAARVVGPSSRYIADSYAFAQTTPVYVVRGGRPFVSAPDATFLASVVDAIWARANRSPWRSEAERDAFKRDIDQARTKYDALARRAGAACRPPVIMQTNGPMKDPSLRDRPHSWRKRRLPARPRCRVIARSNASRRAPMTSAPRCRSRRRSGRHLLAGSAAQAAGAGGGRPCRRLRRFRAAAIAET
jgi:hypothetical protein